MNDHPIPARLTRGAVSGTVDRLGAQGCLVITPVRRETSSALIHAYRHVGERWNLSCFAELNSPTPLAVLDRRHEFADGPPVHISDMPIKVPGQAEHHLPLEVVAAKEAVQIAVDVEYTLNPQYVADYYAYLTLHRYQATAGVAERGSGPHSDSLQGPRIRTKTPIEHGVIVADVDPPLFYCHEFNLADLDSDHDDIARHIYGQADPDQTVRAAPFQLNFFDAYCIHSAVPSTGPIMRTFLRVTYSVRPFDRLGNTVNEAIGELWNNVPRPRPEGLVAPSC